MASPPGGRSASPGGLGSAYPTGSQKAGKNGVLCHLFLPSCLLFLYKGNGDHTFRDDDKGTWVPVLGGTGKAGAG